MMEISTALFKVKITAKVKETSFSKKHAKHHSLSSDFREWI